MFLWKLKTNWMNALFEFLCVALWLTSRWTILNSTMHDDYSLAEIAEEFGSYCQPFMTISNGQRRFWKTMRKSCTCTDYIVRSQIFDQIMEKYPDDSYLQQIGILSGIDTESEHGLNKLSLQGNKSCWLLELEEFSCQGTNHLLTIFLRQCKKASAAGLPKWDMKEVSWRIRLFNTRFGGLHWIDWNRN